MKRLMVVVLLLLIMTSGLSAQEVNTSTEQWWDDVTWYHLFVRSFYDSNGDGIGDIQGLIDKLDYLNDGDPNTTDDLGVTGIKLMPIMQAASYHGYDVIDYYTVDPAYGTNEDFLQLVDEVHARGMVIIIDLVVNHTSARNNWFQQAAAGNPDYVDWYIWRDERPANASGPWGDNAWHRQGDQFYYGVFCCGMPDLNYDNPEVTTAMYDVAEFWLTDMNVDGFRLDAIKYVREDGDILQNSPLNRQWLADFNAHIKSIKPEALVVGEVLDTTVTVVRYVNDGSVDLAFEFDLADDIISSIGAGNARDVTRHFERGLSDYPQNQYVPFLSNHDQVRVMTQLNNNVEQAKLAATILLTTPGSPFIYYGEEIGMPGAKPDPRLRTPMHWDDTAVTAGFTTAATPHEPLTDNLETANIAAQNDDPDSLLNHYRALVHLRNAHSTLRTGDMRVMDRAPRQVFAYLRHDDDGVYMVIMNLDDEPRSGYDLRLSEGPLTGVTSATVIFGDAEATAPDVNDAGGFEDYNPIQTLAPRTSYIIRFE